MPKTLKPLSGCTVFRDVLWTILWKKIRMVLMAVLVGHIVRDICHRLDSNGQSLIQWNTRLFNFSPYKEVRK